MTITVGGKVHHTNHGIGTVAKILGKQNSAVHLSSAQYYLEVDFPHGVENVWSDAVTELATTWRL